MPKPGSTIGLCLSRTAAQLHPDLEFEHGLWQAGLRRLAGIDEAGRGAWAGPVCAAVVILDPDCDNLQCLSGVRDSKQMTPEQREKWAVLVRECSFCWAVGWATCGEIDALGILPAPRVAMTRALAERAVAPGHLLVDAVRLYESDLPQTILIKGDSRSLSIAAASVLAKTARDALMCTCGEDHPGYGFAAHKGYGTQLHQLALKVLGPCSEHRMTYKPLRLD